MQSLNRNRALLFLSVLFLVGFSVADGIKGADFLAQSVDWTLAIMDIGFFKVWFWPFTFVLFQAVLVLAVLGLFYLRDKPDALWLFLAVSLEHVLQNVVKLAYADTRPCFVNERIAQKGCSCSFGKVSGHSSTTAMFYPLAALLLAEGGRLWLQLLAQAAAWFVVLNVGVSRVFYGAHSWNQVVLGWAWGLWCLCLVLVARDLLSHHWLALLRGRARPPARTALFLLAIVLLFVGLDLATVVLWVAGPTQKQDAEMIQTSCREKCVREGGTLGGKHLASVGAGNWPLFVLLLFIFLALPRTMENPDFYRHSFRGFWPVVKRALVFVLVALPLIVMFVLSVYIGALASFLASLGLCAAFAALFVWAGPWLLEKAGCAVRGDFFVDEAGGSEIEMRVLAQSKTELAS